MLRMKRLLLRAAGCVGLPAVFRFFHRNTLTIVLYHGVAPKRDIGKENNLYNYRGKYIAPEDFEWQMQYIKKHYTVLDLEKALSRMRENTLPRNALAITFDDGYRNFYDYAYPILKKNNLTATMFLVSDFVLEKKPLWVDRLEYAMGNLKIERAEKIKKDSVMRQELKRASSVEREQRLRALEQETGALLSDFDGEKAVYAPLSVEQMQEMRALVSFGAHTKTHPILSTESSTDAERDIRESKESLERALGKLSSVFAYPNGQPGDWTEANEQSLKRLGFTYALTTTEGTNTSTTHPFRLTRVVLDSTNRSGAFAAILTGVRSFLKSL